MDKSTLGTQYKCYSCGKRFYDLNRPKAVCPECGADQADAPVKDPRAILKSGKSRKKRKAIIEEEDLPTPDLDDDDEDDVDDLFDDGDDDDLDDLDDLDDDEDEDEAPKPKKKSSSRKKSTASKKKTTKK